MRDDLTDITIVLDRSMSMRPIWDSTIAGYDEFVQGQKEAPGDAYLTLAVFDHEYTQVCSGSIQALEPVLSFYPPRGSTALLDAIGRTIETTGKRLRAMRPEDRPGKVLFVIITDGEENCSHRFTLERINEMIRHQREKYNWEFVFLGANQDAIKAGARMGIRADSSMTFAANDTGNHAVYASLNHMTTAYRGGVVGQCCFTADDREAQKKAGA